MKPTQTRKPLTKTVAEAFGDELVLETEELTCRIAELESENNDLRDVIEWFEHKRVSEME